MYLVPKKDRLYNLHESYQSNTTTYLNLTTKQIWEIKDIKPGLADRPYEYLCIICLDEDTFAIGVPAGIVVSMFNIYTDKNALVESSESFREICKNWHST